jgi:3-hydroxyacyl-[acyl-carrier-protein] dehydratase
MTQSTVIVHDFKKETNSMTKQESVPYLSVEEIMTYIPHRYPMLLIDRVEDMEAGEHAVGVKNVSLNEWFFQGHFPGKPIMPGVLIVEAMAQTAGVVVMKSLGANQDKLVYFMSIDEAKFRKPVVPGDVLKLNVTKDKSRGLVWKFKGKAMVNDVLVAEAIITAMIADR